MVTQEKACVMGAASYGVDFGFRGDVSYQNAMELLAVAFALLLAVSLGAKDNRFNSELAMAASSLVLMICQHFDIVVEGTEHLSSDDN